MTCDRCGVELEIGMHPFCKGTPESHVRGAAHVEAVTWPGGRTFENLGNTPQTFYSPAEYKRYLKTHNLEEFVRHVPVPGSDKSPHTTSWACVSQETLDGAKAMLERMSTASKNAEATTLIESFTCTVTEEVGTVRAPRGTFGEMH